MSYQDPLWLNLLREQHLSARTTARIYETDRGIVITDEHNGVLFDLINSNKQNKGMLLSEPEYTGGPGTVQQGPVLPSPTSKLFSPGAQVVLQCEDANRCNSEIVEIQPLVIKSVRTLSPKEYQALLKPYRDQREDYLAKVKAIKAQAEEAIRQLGPQPSLESLLLDSLSKERKPHA